MKKMIFALLLISLVLTGCTTGTKEIADEEGKAWATENGYVLADDYNIKFDEITSATQTGEGGLNFGDVDWSEDLKKAAIREYLKGDESNLYEDGYNHRNMMQIATSYNNKPIIGSVEFALNDDFTFVAGSEKNTEKLNAMLANPQVSLYWTKQLRTEDGLPSYFYAYGVEVQGKVEFYDWANLSGADLTKALDEVRNYFKTMGAQYGKFYDSKNENYLADADLQAYMQNSPTTYYKIVPNKIVTTSSYLLFLCQQGDAYAVVNSGTGQFQPYTLVSSEFLAKALKEVQAVYPGATFFNASQLYPMLSQMIPDFSQKGGLKTQATLEF